MSARSCLEIRSMDERHDEIVRSDYNRDDQYSVTHPDAKATGDVQGKGVGGSHGHSLPNCNGALGMISYTNFITSPSAGAGNVDDNEARNTAMARSLYNADKQYSAMSVNTQENVIEGQFVVY